MQYTINQLYDLLYQRTNEIYDVFKGFFGEENVDLQKIDEKVIKSMIVSIIDPVGIGIDDFDSLYEISDELLKDINTANAETKSIIYVYWKDVEVTNEHGRSIDIQDLYAKIEIQVDGRIPYENTGFLLNRSTYTVEQFLSNYMHSHIQNIPKDNFTTFMPPCLGRGPIKETIATLKNEYSDITWMLFCQELSMYVTVESIAGVPWNYLERVGKKKPLCEYSGYRGGSALKFIKIFDERNLKDFIKYYLKNGHLSISYKDNKYFCGMPYHEYIIDISNAFIDFYNKELCTTSTKLNNCVDQGLLIPAIVANNAFYAPNASNSNAISTIKRYQDKFVLIFKGRIIYTKIIVPEDSGVTISTLLSNDVAMYILATILRTINFKYKNEYYNRESRGDQEATSTHQKVFYL